MATWTEEFARLSEIERAEIDNWNSGANNANSVISAKEATNAFLIQWQAAGCPPHNQEMP